MEQALRDKPRYLQSILETTSDGFYVVDSLGRLVDVNRAYCRMSAYSRYETQTLGIGDIDSTPAVYGSRYIVSTCTAVRPS